MIMIIFRGYKFYILNICFRCVKETFLLSTKNICLLGKKTDNDNF